MIDDNCLPVICSTPLFVERRHFSATNSGSNFHISSPKAIRYRKCGTTAGRNALKNPLKNNLLLPLQEYLTDDSFFDGTRDMNSFDPSVNARDRPISGNIT
jgi:hypothetical protein